MTFDLLLRGGQVIDGSGTPVVRADVAVRDGQIVAVGDFVFDATTTPDIYTLALPAAFSN